ncbi:hypothetical protein CALCODRAFT_39717 [Calocera cornea HHB12733]|uniref:Pre-mRNA-splicing factor CWC24 n=1 Tax=Calocera cornea HHB12733 TaxID=1353952 RepID=A0A165DXH8_9BASI|nr:hypothetical protein CALCODRAFT_39717 [Calocera cornea HHB12733]
MMADTGVDPTPVPFFRKPPKSRPASSRTKPRSRSPSPSSVSIPPEASTSARLAVAGASAVVLPQKKSVANPLVQGTKGARKRERVDVNYGSGTAALPEGYSLSDEEREETQAINARKRARLDPAMGDEDLPDPDDGMYHGLAGYKRHILKSRQEVPKAMRSGPVRANPSTIRQVTITDYQPDVCKDYKETGYCGFGDTCKFLHDRGTYMAGWQLDRQWEEQQRAGGGASGNADDSASSDEEDIPFACLLCRKPYTDPIVTKCGHYFCSKCAIGRFKKTPKCAACGQATGGMFNGAAKKVEQMRRRMADKAKRDEGEEEDGQPDDE